MGDARNGRRGAMGDAHRYTVVVGVRPVGVRYVGATRRVAPPRWATHRVVPTRTDIPWWGLGRGLWGVRHAVPRPFWTTRRVAPTRLVTHRIALTRTGVPWWGLGRGLWGARHAVPRPFWTTRRVAPTMGNPTRWVAHAMGDAPRCPDAHRDGRMGTAYRTPTIVGDPARWATRTGMSWWLGCGLWGYGT
ncbi:hypothetical protein [Chloroflexus aggregans]|uniref:hypothetical protein n=1 Tax=Chloroflexus aggregans TaxID=152260 RepID=UPI00059C2667|nr:hypothetical protein [Chloroflexus aggregans]